MPLPPEEMSLLDRDGRALVGFWRFVGPTVVGSPFGLTFDITEDHALPLLRTEDTAPMPRLGIPLKWHGGKYYLAPQIVGLMPPHTHYVEPFCGGGAVLLCHSGEGRSELVNDVDRRLVNFWRVLQGAETFAAMARRLEATPLSRGEWDDSAAELDEGDDVSRACAFFIRCRQSLAGRMTGFTPPTRTRLRRNMNGNVSEWLGAVDGLAEVHARVRRVFIEEMDAVDLMAREDTPGTLFYCDPPYLHETRATPNAYAHEMTGDQHQSFLEVARGLEGKVMISGYPSDLYDLILGDWTRHEFDLPNHAAGGEGKRRMTEVLWTNF